MRGFEMMGDERTAEELKIRFGFTYRELISLTGDFDMFHLQERGGIPGLEGEKTE